MKKTEKIELRVDHSEKDRLTAIAERRGQTVSDVVRDALAGELGVARNDYPKWPGFLSIVAITVAFGAAIFSVIDEASDGPSSPIMSQLSFFTPDNDRVLDTFVPHRGGFLKTYSIKSGGSDFQTTVEVVDGKVGTFDVIIKVCQQLATECAPTDRAEITLAQPTDYIRSGSALIYQTDSPMWYIRTISPRLLKIQTEQTDAS